jgi:hypothetical protein
MMKDTTVLYLLNLWSNNTFKDNFLPFLRRTSVDFRRATFDTEHSAAIALEVKMTFLFAMFAPHCE